MMADVYESDLKAVAHLMNVLGQVFNESPQTLDHFVLSAELRVWNRNDYPVGTIVYVDDQFYFTPRDDADD